MKVSAFLLTIAISFPSFKSQEIDDEAPIFDPNQLSSREECELLNYSRRLLTLLLSEDSNPADLTRIQPDELTAFHDEVFSYLTLARFGAQNIADQARRDRRVQFFSYHLTLTTLNLVSQHCTRHYVSSWVHGYNRSSNLIVLRSSVRYDPGTCLCGNYRERSSIDVPFIVPMMDRSDSALQVGVYNHVTQVTEVTEYHVIPLALISKFFQTWLSDEATRGTNFNNCIKTLFLRLKRSLRKILMASLGRSLSLEEMVARTHGMLSGNVFLGPINRGPFNPEFRRIPEEAFESAAEPIIGTQRYNKSLMMFYNLLTFVRNAHAMEPFLRLLNGLNLFFQMHLDLHGLDVVPFDIRKWERREPREAELDNIESREVRRELRSQKFWAVKKPYPRRDPRSIQDKYTNDRTKHQWSEFVLELMTTSLEATSKEESSPWSCNFTILFNDYSFRKSGQDEECIGFDEFLYRRIPQSDWQKCLELNSPKAWCLAWKRVAKNLRKDTSLLKPLKVKPKYQAYSKDLKTVIKKLVTEHKHVRKYDNVKNNTVVDRKMKNFDLVRFLKHPYHKEPSKVGVLVDDALCIASSVLPRVLEDCLELFSKK